MGVQRGDRNFRDVMQLCAAIRQAEGVLFLDGETAIQLRQHLAVIDEALIEGRFGEAQLVSSLKAVRYILMESADGPIAPFLADSVATIVGDGHGKIFFKPPS
ncbi:hypothetical protein [Actinoplanes sp. NPDC049599]|uniref:hypothetical protein n=1 Tax=Actinoplanes sp. NPDC049599 TaxID=3363903 RepID=UPI00379C7903